MPSKVVGVEGFGCCEGVYLMSSASENSDIGLHLGKVYGFLLSPQDTAGHLYFIYI